MTITVIDAAERIEKVLPELTSMLAGGVVTVDDAEVRYQAGTLRGGLPDVPVGDAMTRDPEAIAPDTPIAQLVERMLERDYTAMPVVDRERRLLGVVDESALLERGLTELSLSLHKVVGLELVKEYLSRIEKERAVASQVMQEMPVVSREMPLREAAHLMHERGVKRLPVVDPGGRLVGVLGRLDILESIARGHARRIEGCAGSLPQEHRTVGAIMERQVPAVAEDTPLLDVLDWLLDSQVKRVVVVDAGKRPVGIITDTDLVARVDPDDRPGMLALLRSRWSEQARERVRRARGQRAGDVMSRPVVSLHETAPVMEALALSATRHIKRLPVTDAEGHLVGVVSRPILLAASLELASRSAG